MSFFPLKDSSGATQLVVKRDGSAAGLSDVTVESVVLVEGEVSLRPENQRRVRIFSRDRSRRAFIN